MRRRGELPLQLLAGRRPTRAGCGGARRSSSTARPSPTGSCVLDVDALAEAEDENWVWQGAAVLRPGYRRGARRAVARRRGRDRGARVRPRDARRSSRTGSRCPRRRAGSAGSTRTASTSAPTSATGSLTSPATRGSPRSGGAARRSTRRPPCSRASRTTCRPARTTTRPRASSATSSYRSLDFYRTEKYLRTPAASWSASTCRTTRRPSAHREWLLISTRTRVDGRRHDLPGGRAARRAVRRLPGRRARARRSCSSPTSTPRSPTTRGPATT